MARMLDWERFWSWRQSNRDGGASSLHPSSTSLPACWRHYQCGANSRRSPPRGNLQCGWRRLPRDPRRRYTEQTSTCTSRGIAIERTTCVWVLDPSFAQRSSTLGAYLAILRWEVRSEVGRRGQLPTRSVWGKRAKSIRHVDIIFHPWVDRWIEFPPLAKGKTCFKNSRAALRSTVSGLCIVRPHTQAVIRSAFRGVTR